MLGESEEDGSSHIADATEGVVFALDSIRPREATQHTVLGRTRRGVRQMIEAHPEQAPHRQSVAKVVKQLLDPLDSGANYQTAGRKNQQAAVDKRQVLVLSGKERPIRTDTEVLQEQLNKVVREVRHADLYKEQADVNAERKLRSLKKQLKGLNDERLTMSLQRRDMAPESWRTTNIRKYRPKVEDALSQTYPERRARKLRSMEANARRQADRADVARVARIEAKVAAEQLELALALQSTDASRRVSESTLQPSELTMPPGDVTMLLV